MSNDFSRLADALRKRARDEITTQINGVLPSQLRVNPEDLDDDDEDDYEDEYDEDEEDEDDE